MSALTRFPNTNFAIPMWCNCTKVIAIILCAYVYRKSKLAIIEPSSYTQCTRPDHKYRYSEKVRGTIYLRPNCHYIHKCIVATPCLSIYYKHLLQSYDFCEVNIVVMKRANNEVAKCWYVTGNINVILYLKAESWNFCPSALRYDYVLRSFLYVKKRQIGYKA